MESIWYGIFDEYNNIKFCGDGFPMIYKAWYVAENNRREDKRERLKKLFVNVLDTKVHHCKGVNFCYFVNNPEECPNPCIRNNKRKRKTETLHTRNCRDHGLSPHEIRAVCLQCEEVNNDIADQARLFREICAIFMRDGGQFHSRHGDTRTFREITKFFYKYVDQEKARPAPKSAPKETEEAQKHLTTGQVSQ